ncbi:MAG: flagellar basal-body rod protein FlgG [Clostridiales bacterium]
MMRALWTASTGMKSQQFNVDVISNNLANVNTTGFKKDTAEFKDLIYETIGRAYVLENSGKPVNLQIGHGVETAATVKTHTSGNLEKTDNPLNFAIEGEAYFVVGSSDENVFYTRDGSFKLSIGENGNMLTTTDGLPILDVDGNEIIINVPIERLNVSVSGELNYIDNDGKTISLDQTINLVKFPNQNGLESIGSNFFRENTASGTAVPDSEIGLNSQIKQGFLESSNVQVVEEMVRLITAQRAYELNSKAIQTADDMLQMANNLRR